jgi:hypothetical protein
LVSLAAARPSTARAEIRGIAFHNAIDDTGKPRVSSDTTVQLS